MQQKYDITQRLHAEINSEISCIGFIPFLTVILLLVQLWCLPALNISLGIAYCNSVFRQASHPPQN